MAVLAVGFARWPGLQTAFDSFVQSLMATLPATQDELPWYFERRRLVARGDFAQVSVWDLRRYRELRRRFDSPVYDRMYADWNSLGNDTRIVQWRLSRHAGRGRHSVRLRAIRLVAGVA